MKRKKRKKEEKREVVEEDGCVLMNERERERFKRRLSSTHIVAESGVVALMSECADEKAREEEVEQCRLAE